MRHIVISIIITILLEVKGLSEVCHCESSEKFVNIISEGIYQTLEKLLLLDSVLYCVRCAVISNSWEYKGMGTISVLLKGR